MLPKWSSLTSVNIFATDKNPAIAARNHNNMESSRYISDLKQDILKRISDLNPMVKADKIALSRLYETLTGKSIRKDESRGDNFVIITH